MCQPNPLSPSERLTQLEKRIKQLGDKANQLRWMYVRSVSWLTGG
jgi:hypothetical protein